MIEQLLSTPHANISLDHAKKLVRFTRTALGYRSAPELEADCVVNLQLLDSLDRKHLTLLIDLREAPPRNDDAFEQTMKDFRRNLCANFVRSAVLVRTAVGKLQVKRLAQHDRVEMLITQEELEALSYLLEEPGLQAPPSSR